MAISDLNIEIYEFYKLKVYEKQHVSRHIQTHTDQ